MKIPDKKILIVLVSCLLFVIGVAGATLPRRQAQERSAADLSAAALLCL